MPAGDMFSTFRFIMASVGGNNDEQVWIAYLCFSGRNVLQRPTVPFTSAREVLTTVKRGVRRMELFNPANVY
jgi:hypothetical protein